MRGKRRMREKRRAMRKIGDSYWFTAKAFDKPCAYPSCSSQSSVVVRPRDQRYVCAECVAQTGIKAKGECHENGLPGGRLLVVTGGEPRGGRGECCTLVLI
jgi:hypothetical protein